MLAFGLEQSHSHGRLLGGQYANHMSIEALDRRHTIARSWTRNSYVVLRMDLAGLGDSSARPGRPDNEVYPPAAIDDIRVAIEFTRARYRVTDVARVLSLRLNGRLKCQVTTG